MSYAHGGKYLQKHTRERALALAERFSADAEALLPARRVTFLEGRSGALAVQAVVAAMRGDDRGSRAKIQARPACCAVLGKTPAVVPLAVSPAADAACRR